MTQLPSVPPLPSPRVLILFYTSTGSVCDLCFWLGMDFWDRPTNPNFSEEPHLHHTTTPARPVIKEKIRQKRPVVGEKERKVRTVFLKSQIRNSTCLLGDLVILFTIYYVLIEIFRNLVYTGSKSHTTRVPLERLPRLVYNE